MSPFEEQPWLLASDHWVTDALHIEDIQLLTLKGHLVVEDALKYLLASKLGADPAEFVLNTDIRSFPLLVRLALCGETSEIVALDAPLLLLNDARNKMSHWIAHPKFEERVDEFIRHVATSFHFKYGWPTSARERPDRLRRAVGTVAINILAAAHKAS